MRILVDECVPRPFARELAGHHVRTVSEMGWAGRRNGELLAAMKAIGFEALITVDRGMRHQQKPTQHGVAVVVLLARSNRLADLLPLVSRLEAKLKTLAPGEVIEIAAS